jgi:hypothetical protein
MSRSIEANVTEYHRVNDLTTLCVDDAHFQVEFVTSQIFIHRLTHTLQSHGEVIIQGVLPKDQGTKCIHLENEMSEKKKKPNNNQMLAPQEEQFVHHKNRTYACMCIKHLWGEGRKEECSLESHYASNHQTQPVKEKLVWRAFG